jgi:elongation factor G
MFKFIFKQNFINLFKFTNKRFAVDIPTESYGIELIRNIGIIAHIDAGKTTTTERMLFYSGVIDKPGEVHHGNTVTDYMQQERERGITIRAASISFDWKEHQINLIDTPGHIDFTAEVERSLRVLDGAVVILDASMGVETQTMTVWKQADKYNLPRLAYINKIDKAGASVDNTLMAIYKRLNVKPLLINYPNGEENMFTSLIDLVAFKQVKFRDSLGLDMSLEDIDKNDKNFKKYQKLRETLIEEILSHDENLMSRYLEGENLEVEDIIPVLRRICIEGKAVLVLCGSSLKNKGVQQVLDSVVAFLPCPLDTLEVKATKLDNNTLVSKHCKNKGPACGLIFKIINDKERGLIAFFKLYEGILKNKTTLRFLNPTTSFKERVVQLVRMKANECISLNSIGAGDIGGIVGLKHINSGDTFIDTENDNELCILPGVYTPEPVFFCSIYPKRNNELKPLMQALENISKEDSSLKVKYDKETAQTLLCGLGELHLEIIRDRIELEYGISPQLGKMKVSFRESVKKSSKLSYKLEREFNGKSLYFEIELEVYPISEEITLDNINIEELLNEESGSIKSENDSKRFQLFSIARYNSVDIDKDNPLQLLIKDENGKVIYKINFPFENLESKIDTIKYDDGEEETFKSLDLLLPDYKRYLFECIIESLKCGSLLGYQNINIGVNILKGKYSTSRTEDVSVKVAIAEGMKNTLLKSEPTFMEPFMLLEIDVPNNYSSEIISDLSRRRGKIVGIICQDASAVSTLNKGDNFLYNYLTFDRKIVQDELFTKIYAIAPLTEMIGYPGYIRSLSKGEGKVFMKFYHYDYVGSILHSKILDQSYFYE